MLISKDKLLKDQKINRGMSYRREVRDARGVRPYRRSYRKLWVIVNISLDNHLLTIADIDTL